MSESVTKSAASIPEQAMPAADAPPDQVGVAGSVPLATFLAGAGSLTLAQRHLLVDQALVLLEQNYVHLPLKAAMHAVNPVQRLRLLRARLERQTAGTMEPEWLFHRQMSAIFHSVRDLHTNYLLPAPFAGKIAYLPFLIEKCSTTRRATTTSSPGPWPGSRRRRFGAGVEVTHWNGIPIARAVELNGARFAGSNEAANLARGLESLTMRPLVIQLPPDEDWVTVTYLGTDGASHELRRAVAGRRQPAADDRPRRGQRGRRLAGRSTSTPTRSRRAKKLLFVAEVVDLEASEGAGQLDHARRRRRGGRADDACRVSSGPASVDHRVRDLRAPADLHLQRATTRSRSWTSSSGWSACCRRTG